MTLHIIHSNKVEKLHDELCYLLENSPLENPFDVETIVCPSKAMARWINIRFTQKMGIAAHYDYPMPSSWVWQLAEQCLPNVPDQDPLQRELLAWRIFHVLDQVSDIDAFKTIKHYLKHDDDTTKRWSLAKNIASVFERYQHFRPKLIQQWDNEANDDWQSLLWQQISQTIKTNRVQLLIDLGRILSKNLIDLTLPKRVTFFSVTALPPLLFKNIQALAKHCDVYFFVLSPSPHYWSDFVTLKQQAKLRLNSPELNDYYTTGHELLASWGRQGQVFQDMLLHELDDSLTQHYDIYDEDFSPNLLNQLQQSLFDLSDSNESICIDDSIRINQCHSPLRECEIIHDQCLSLLQNSDITPEDILVIVPNMDQYAVSIEAVFKKSADQHNVKPFIPWNLSDSSLHAENPLIHTFLNALNLVNSRFSASDILAYLDCPELLLHFKIAESDKVVIRDYINSAHVNWGFDAAHKHDLGVPETVQNTWHQAQQRFYSFYAVDEQNMQQGIVPLTGFSSSRATVIAQFLYLIDTLNNIRHSLNYSRVAIKWQHDLNYLLDILFGHKDDNGCQIIRDAIDEFVVCSHQELPDHAKLNRALVHRWLEDYFNNNQSNQRFFTGGITFCGMRPMRSVPFKVIIMLGMNEHEFPRHNHPLEFDLMAQQWQPGDLLISDEDRYLFLEAILCARQTLIVSYCAKSLKDNSDKDPSHLVSELCDYLDAHFMVETEPKKLISACLKTAYPMHAFSVKNYELTFPSFNRYWGHVAKQLQHKEVILESYQSIETLDAIPVFNEIVDLDRLCQCLKDPLTFYFKTKLKIAIYDEQEAQDDEPFSLDALQKWSLKNQLINEQLQLENYSLENIVAQAVLPHGIHAKTYFEQIEVDVETQFEGLNDYLQQKPHSISIDLLLPSNNRITGVIKHYYPKRGLLFITPSNFGAKPFMQAWLMHCVLSASQKMNTDEHCLLRCKDKTVLFNYLTPRDATQYLEDALKVMQNALQTPLTVLPKCSFAYQYHLMMHDEEKALKEALLKWHGNPQNEASLGEKENNLIKLTFQEFAQEPSLLFQSDTFKQHAQMMYENALKHCQFEAKV